MDPHKPSRVTEVLWGTADGVVVVERLSDRVLFLRLEGNLPAAAGTFVADQLDRELSGKPGQHLFWDMSRLDAYDTMVRTRATASLVRHRPEIASLHAIMSSRIVSMGVAVANIALGGFIQTHTHRYTFEQALREAAPG